MKVFLCEKPSQAKDIVRAVGARNSGDGCISGDGHLLEQAPPEHYRPELKS